MSGERRRWRRGPVGAIAFVGLGVWLVAACGSSGKTLTGFSCGGFAGTHCPPASSCDGTCGNPDCGVPCVANVRCQGASTNCPIAYTCDSASQFCVPKKTCVNTAQCAATEWCAAFAWGLSNGICVPVDALVQPPPASCAWPFTSRSGACGVPCDSIAASDGGTTTVCPPSLTCDTKTYLCK
jgi:hypothetical protein